MSDTLEALVGRVQQRVGSFPDYFLIQDWINSAYQDYITRREWSWRRRSAEFVFNAAYSTGTVTIVRGEDFATFSGATLTQSMVGRQLRAGGNANPIYTIMNINGSIADLDRIWTAASVSGVAYEIYTCYVTVPAEFDMFMAIVDLGRQYQIDYWSMTGPDLDARDPQRSTAGNQAYFFVLRDYAPANIGVIGSVVQALGSGDVPVSGGTYLGISDTVFTLEMTSTTEFQWKRDNGSYTSAVSIDPDGIAQDLAAGVQIAFPSGGTYELGDIFTVTARAIVNAGQPRYEAWPHIKVDECRPYMFLATPGPLTDLNMPIPRYVSSQYLLEKALAQCASWKAEGNAYYDLKLSQLHELRAEQLAMQAEREDQGRETSDVNYGSWSSFPIYDSGYLASHDVGYELDTL